MTLSLELINSFQPLIDSRSLLDAAKTLFFAIRTERNDGHRYIQSLYDRGVRAFVVNNDFRDDDELMPEAQFYHVADTLGSLQQLAVENRARYGLPLIAITGSRGKTMVKEWLNQLLQPEHNIIRNPRSYNSQIGVPLSLWRLSGDYNLGIFEAGISQAGEMGTLEHMLRPDMVVLTNINDEHGNGFGSKRQKLTEKLLLAKNARVLFYDFTDNYISSAVEEAIAAGDLRADIVREDTSVARAGNISNQHITSGWELANLATSAAVMRHLGYDAETISHRIAELRPIGTRLNVVDAVNHCLIVADDYVCDMASLIPALDFVARRATADRTLTLMISDLSHENLPEDETYKNLAEICALKGVNRVLGIGPQISKYASLFPDASKFFVSGDEALAHLSPTDFDHEMILVKPANIAPFDKITHLLEARSHETVLEVNLDALVNNFNFFRSKLKPTTGVVAMVKASGYGAGSYELAKTLQNRGAAYLAVAVLDEGVELRQAGITMPIMVLNPKVLNYRLLFANSLEPEIFSFDILNEIITEARKLGVKNYPVHIKLDTGMHRLGFLEKDIDRIIQIVKEQDNISISSVFSHLATADCRDMNQYTEAQLSLFQRCSQKIVDAFPYHIKRHILNTAGIIRYPEYQYDMVRLGIGLYGIPVLNDGSEDELQPVSTLRTIIIALNEWPAGTAIGYGRHGMLKRDSLIATIPIGYADGINRHMGRGNSSFWVHGVKCATVGNICMDICMIDVTDVPYVKVGDSVEIFGRNNLAIALAENIDTIPYEILTSVSPRVRRIYYSE